MSKIAVSDSLYTDMRCCPLRLFRQSPQWPPLNITPCIRSEDSSFYVIYQSLFYTGQSCLADNLHHICVSATYAFLFTNQTCVLHNLTDAAILLCYSLYDSFAVFLKKCL